MHISFPSCCPNSTSLLPSNHLTITFHRADLSSALYIAPCLIRLAFRCFQRSLKNSQTHWRVLTHPFHPLSLLLFFSTSSPLALYISQPHSHDSALSTAVCNGPSDCLESTSEASPTCRATLSFFLKPAPFLQKVVADQRSSRYWEESCLQGCRRRAFDAWDHKQTSNAAGELQLQHSHLKKGIWDSLVIWTPEAPYLCSKTVCLMTYIYIYIF